MKTTGIATIDHAPQVVAEWINELADALGWSEKGAVYMLLRETLHAVRDQLSPDEAADLAAQLPVLIRGIYYEGWVPAHVPEHPRDKAHFLGRVTKRFTGPPMDDAEAAVSAVFGLLERHVSTGETDQVRRAMRKPLRDLWP